MVISGCFSGAGLRASRPPLILSDRQGRPAIITRARHRNGPALSAWVASIITVSSATRPTRAGKMFSACKANIISACGKNVFYRIDRHPPEAAGAAPAARARPGGRRATPFGRRHGLRPTATACGRHALPGERATPWRAIMHRNQDQGRWRNRGKSCTAIKLRWLDR